MARFSKAVEPVVAEVTPAAPAVKRERLGVFMSNWKIVKSYGPSASNKHVTSFRSGQLIFKQDEINSLIEQGAPLRVYVHEQPGSSTD